MDLDTLESNLHRREALLRRYVAIRGWVGAILIPIGIAILGLSLLVLFGHAPDVSFIPKWSKSTMGALMVSGIIWVIGFILLRVGIGFWRARTPDKDTGCLLC